MARLYGIIVGLATLVIIGFFHPVVIKTEYYPGTKAWPGFLVLGAASLAASVLVAAAIVRCPPGP